MGVKVKDGAPVTSPAGRFLGVPGTMRAKEWSPTCKGDRKKRRRNPCLDRVGSEGLGPRVGEAQGRTGKALSCLGGGGDNLRGH